MSIKDNLINIKNNLPASVRLVAVSKFHSAQEVIEAIQAGQTVFGENRVQEAAAKFDEVKKSYPNASLRIIGQLQRNKTKEAVRIADAIDSVDRIELLDEIEKQAAKIDKKIQVLFEFHTGEESKSGFADPALIIEALQKMKDGVYPHIEPKGFMTMAPFTEDKDLVRASFKKLRDLRDQCQKAFPDFDLSELSMGMSGDWQIAVEEGSTMVRIGTAIFGARDYSQAKKD
ncbi:MAG: YggS family pyridoxal phosphate-dependent enzyme [Treponema sp.]|nr:YggS family pyridoxal phosphate-dependent enzyme [Treponema sp.]